MLCFCTVKQRVSILCFRNGCKKLICNQQGIKFLQIPKNDEPP